MSYVAQKMREAIMAAKGDRNAAARRLMAMAGEDLALLRAITAPYLQGIAFALVEKAMGKQPGTMDVTPTGAVRSRSAPPASPATAPAARPGRGGAAFVNAARRAPGPSTLPPETLDAIIDKLDRNIPAPPKAPAGPPTTPAEALATIGIDPKGPPPTKAGVKHKAAMVEMAKAFRKL